VGYFKANDILPNEIIEEVQKYIDGELVYIPRKENTRKKWGSKTGVKIILADRNRDIYQDYQSGMSFDALSEKYYLVPKSIKRIILHQKKNR
jgi:Mor family transcriptional regulator